MMDRVIRSIALAFAGAWLWKAAHAKPRARTQSTSPLWQSRWRDLARSWNEQNGLPENSCASGVATDPVEGGAEMLRLDCNACGTEYSPEEAIVNTYENSKYNHVDTKCPVCGIRFILFFDDPMFLTLGYPWNHQQKVPPHIKDIKRQLDGKPSKLLPPGPSPDELMDKAIAGKFHDWLETISPDDFVG